MDSLIAVAMLVGIGYVVFKSGKQIGSRLGFGAGRRFRGRRFR